MLHFALLFPARFSWIRRQTLDIFFVGPLQEVALIFMTLWNWRDFIMIFAKTKGLENYLYALSNEAKSCLKL